MQACAATSMGRDGHCCLELGNRRKIALKCGISAGSAAQYGPTPRRSAGWRRFDQLTVLDGIAEKGVCLSYNNMPVTGLGTMQFPFHVEGALDARHDIIQGRRFDNYSIGNVVSSFFMDASTTSNLGQYEFGAIFQDTVRFSSPIFAPPRNEQEISPETVITKTVQFEFGDSIDLFVFYNSISIIDLTNIDGADDFSVAAAARFGDTITLGPIKVFDAQGKLLDDVTISSRDGIDYLSPVVVPIPAAIWGFLSGISLLGALRSRKRRFPSSTESVA